MARAADHGSNGCDCRPSGCVLALLAQHQADRPITHLRGKLVRRLVYRRPFLSGVRASGNLGAVQIIDLETSTLTPEKDVIIHFYAVNRWADEYAFDEWAKPSVALSPEAEQVIRLANELLMHCRPTDVVPDHFLAFLERQSWEHGSSKNSAVILHIGVEVG